MEILDYRIDELIPELNLGEKSNFVFATINPHSYSIAKNDLVFREALFNADCLLPDGVGFVLAARILKFKSLKRITGSDLHTEILNHLNKTNGKVFYLGASDSTLKIIHQKLMLDYPNVKMDYFSPPYKENFTLEENNEIIQRIRFSKPNVLFVGMTAPKQEKWVFKNKEFLNVDYIASIGAVFDFYSGNVKRSGKFWQKIGLEWLPRLLMEPKRLWKRTFISFPIFFIDVLLKRITLK